MTSFISAGHDLRNKGAQANDFAEEREMINFRNLVISKYKKMYPNSKVVQDNDIEPLRDYLKRIQTGNGSVVVEFHLDYFSNSKVSGTSVWVGDDADKLDLSFAKELAQAGATTMGIPNRGVFREKQSFHKKLGLMREQGIVALVEIVPISNKGDMEKFHKYMDALAFEYARIIKKYDDMI